MKVGLLYLHGMGKDKALSHKRLTSNIQKLLDDKIELSIEPVMYYEKMQRNQSSMLDRMGRLGLHRMRDFVISSLGDVATIGYDWNAYVDTMYNIDEGLSKLRERLPEGTPIIVVAQSLGCQVFSNYVWDEQSRDNNLNDIKLFYTTGCNIPIFISGLSEKDITPFKRISEEFRWVNFWIGTDVLGYPLQSLCPAYADLVEDVKIPSFLPIMSHVLYSRKSKVYTRIAKDISKMFNLEIKQDDSFLDQFSDEEYDCEE